MNQLTKDLLFLLDNIEMETEDKKIIELTKLRFPIVKEYGYTVKYENQFTV